jgi:hypothetical protein
MQALTPSYIDEVLTSLTRNPDRFKPHEHGRGARHGPREIPDTYSDHVEVQALPNGKDAKVVLSAAHIKAWRHSLWHGAEKRKLHLVFDTLRPKMAMLVPVESDMSGERGLYTLTQRKPQHQASFTTTWAYLKLTPPVSGRLTAPFKLVASRPGDYVSLLDLSELADLK